VASLDPLARREFLQDLMESVAEQEVSVVLSSHLISDLERACDYVIVLVDSRVRVAQATDPSVNTTMPAAKNGQPEGICADDPFELAG
jgi:ABC-2 type transport system ATP-binding protein